MPSKTTTAIPDRADRRVMVFIDGSNLYHVLEQNCSRHDVQFDKFAMKLANGRDLRRIYYYNIRQENERHEARPEQERFLHSLYDTPYVEVRLGIGKQRGEQMVEKGVDVMLATDLVVRAFQDQYDTAIIVSGDGDFYPAIQAVKDRGKQVEVAAFATNISPEAARAADLHLKLTKTFFTGLWMTRARARAVSQMSRKPEVKDEASSPNGEDKPARTPRSRASTARQRSTSAASSEERAPAARAARSATHGRKTTAASRRTAANNKAEKSAAVEKTAAKRSSRAKSEPESPEPATVNGGAQRIRRTPSRRRVGGTAAQSSNGRSRAGAAVKDHSSETAEQASDGAKGVQGVPAGRRSSWLRRLGLLAGEK